MNEVLIIIIAAAFLSFLIYYFRNSRTSQISSVREEEDRFVIETIVKFIRDSFNEILNTNLYEMNITREEFNKRIHNKNRLRKALKTAPTVM